MRLSAPAMLLAAAAALHNLEEGLAYPSMRAAITDRLRSLDLTSWSPPPAVFAAALIALTVAVALAMAWAGRGAPSGRKRALVRLVAWVLLLNVFLPHVPAIVVMGGYAPGVITALAINLPLSLWVLRRTA